MSDETTPAELFREEMANEFARGFAQAEIDYQVHQIEHLRAEIVRLRRVNAELVAALRVARAWMPVMPPVDECAREDCEIVESALRSATETKDEPT